MKPEILLKAYVEYQSEDAFRDLIASTLDEVYSAALRIVHGPPHLAEEIAVRVYLELARQAPDLGKDVVLASWLRERTCKLAVTILRAEDRAIDRAALKRERNHLPAPAVAQPAPPGLAIRICQTVFLSAAHRRRPGFFSLRLRWPAWIRPLPAAGLAVGLLAIIVWWDNPFHRRNPIIRSQAAQMMPASFAQLASPEEGGPPIRYHSANTNAGLTTNQR